MLVVDDDDDDRAMFAEYLEHAGFSVETDRRRGFADAIVASCSTR